MFVLTSFVLNACCGLSGDPAPGRSPGPPETIATTSQLNNDITTITATTPHIHLVNTFSSNVDTTDNVQIKNRFSETPQPLPIPNESVVNSKHRDHNRKSHGNSANTHHKLAEKLGRTVASKAGMIISIFSLSQKF